MSCSLTLKAVLAVLLVASGGACAGQVFAPLELFCDTCILPWFVDIDQDDTVDVVTVTDNLVYGAINHGAGVIDDPIILTNVPSNGRVLFIGDAGMDGGTDMLVHDTLNNELSLITDIVQQDPLTQVLDTSFIVDYAPVVGYGTRGRAPVRVGHFNGDAWPDIFTTATGGMGKWYRNDSSAGYILQEIANNYGYPYDWDGDGDTDLLQDQNGVLSVSITVGTAMGLPPVVLGFSGQTTNSSQIGAADVDGNGTEDMVIAGAIVFRTSDGLNELFCCEPVDGFRFRQVLDLDCDGTLEILDANSTAGSVEMSIQNFTGTGVTVDTLFIPAVLDIDIAVADLDADGRTDLFYQRIDSIDQPIEAKKVFLRRNIAWPESVDANLPEQITFGDVWPLDSGIPEGGIYEGPGVFGDSLYSGLTGTGPITVQYSYQNPQTGCIGTDTDALDIVTGVNERNMFRALRAAPNPASDKVVLSTPDERSGTLLVRDYGGRVCVRVPDIRLSSERPYVLTVGHLVPGLYLISLEMEGQAAYSTRIQVLR